MKEVKNALEWILFKIEVERIVLVGIFEIILFEIEVEWIVFVGIVEIILFVKVVEWIFFFRNGWTYFIRYRSWINSIWN